MCFSSAPTLSRSPISQSPTTRWSPLADLPASLAIFLPPSVDWRSLCSKCQVDSGCRSRRLHTKHRLYRGWTLSAQSMTCLPLAAACKNELSALALHDIYAGMSVLRLYFRTAKCARAPSPTRNHITEILYASKTMWLAKE